MNHTYHFVRPDGKEGHTTLYVPGQMDAKSAIEELYKHPAWEGHEFAHVHSYEKGLTPFARPPEAGGKPLTDRQKANLLPQVLDAVTEGHPHHSHRIARHKEAVAKAKADVEAKSAAESAGNDGTGQTTPKTLPAPGTSRAAETAVVDANPEAAEPPTT